MTKQKALDGGRCFIMIGVPNVPRGHESGMEHVRLFSCDPFVYGPEKRFELAHKEVKVGKGYPDSAKGQAAIDAALTAVGEIAVEVGYTEAVAGNWEIRERVFTSLPCDDWSDLAELPESSPALIR